MAYHLCGAKPLLEPMVTYCQLISEEQASLKFEPEYLFFKTIFQNIVLKTASEMTNHCF